MHKPPSIVQARQSVGVVHCLDTVNRELTVRVSGQLWIFDVPVECKIVLHGERVRFRMLQPADRVRITHAGQGDRPVAIRIEVGSPT
ncbi:MAG TPA: hypothetical protein VFA18_01100 [Gemmataceae bacterium]|nr:hypothetical protein [Gemmataceae bacterium]